MPRLHRYRNRDACYVLTNLGGAVVTFQLTPRGAEKLHGAGIAPSMQFRRAMLLDLIRTGDAFTHGGGVDDTTSKDGQMDLDLTNDPHPETALPMCGECRKAEGLHLVLSGSPDALRAELLCPECRARAGILDTSIPLSVVTLPVLLHLVELKRIRERHESVSRYEELLHTESSLRWDEMKKQRAATQGFLFEGKGQDELM